MLITLMILRNYNVMLHWIIFSTNHVSCVKCVIPLLYTYTNGISILINKINNGQTETFKSHLKAVFHD